MLMVERVLPGLKNAAMLSKVQTYRAVMKPCLRALRPSVYRTFPCTSSLLLTPLVIFQSTSQWYGSLMVPEQLSVYIPNFHHTL